MTMAALAVVTGHARGSWLPLSDTIATPLPLYPTPNPDIEADKGSVPEDLLDNLSRLCCACKHSLTLSVLFKTENCHHINLGVELGTHPYIIVT